MDINLMITLLEEEKSKIKNAHSLVVSNGLSNKDLDEEFESVESKINTLINSFYKTLDFTPAEFEYTKPALIQSNETVSEQTVASILSLSAGRISSVQNALKASKYRFINKSNNSVLKINNSIKSLITKTHKQVSELSLSFVPAPKAKKK